MSSACHRVGTEFTRLSPHLLHVVLSLASDSAARWPQGFLSRPELEVGGEGRPEPARCRQRCLNDLDTSSPSTPASREQQLLGTQVPPWQSLHRARSLAPFLHLTGGSRKPAPHANGPLSLEAWQTLPRQGSPKPQRAGQGLRGTKAIFKSKRATGS